MLIAIFSHFNTDYPTLNTRNNIATAYIEGTKKPPEGGFTTLLIALIILEFPMVPGAGLAPAQPKAEGF